MFLANKNFSEKCEISAEQKMQNFSIKLIIFFLAENFELFNELNAKKCEIFAK